MTAKLHAWGQKIKQHPFITVGIVVALLAIIAFTFAVHVFGWDWTGFTGGESKITITSTSKGITTAKELQPGKALWDWLNLLGVFAIPAVVGLGAAWYTAQQGKVSDRENTDNQREQALQTYIDKMSELLLEKKLRESAKDDELRKIARVRTLTVLPRLDPIRKASVLQFLYESGLIDKHKGIVDLDEANLRDANLRLANLNGANLNGANLKQAFLRGAFLLGADLNGADLMFAQLNGADLSYAVLKEADLNGALLVGVNLDNANLEGATGISNKELEKEAKSLKGATMPDGKIHS